MTRRLSPKKASERRETLGRGATGGESPLNLENLKKSRSQTASKEGEETGGREEKGRKKKCQEHMFHFKKEKGGFAPLP